MSIFDKSSGDDRNAIPIKFDNVIFAMTAKKRLGKEILYIFPKFNPLIRTPHYSTYTFLCPWEKKALTFSLNLTRLTSSRLKSKCAGYFSAELLCLLRHTDELQ